MQYETIFDIHDAYPHHWSDLWLGAGVALLFVMARFRQNVLEATEARQKVLGWIPREIWPRLLRPYASFLLDMLVLSIIELAIMMAPRWRWGVAAGLAIFCFGVWQIQADLQQIAGLRNPDATETLEGPVTRIGSFVSNGERHGFIEVGSHLFSYRSDDAGSPYAPTNKIVFKGQNVRISHVENRIVKVERQLCLTYRRCTVRYILGIRLERDAL